MFLNSARARQRESEEERERVFKEKEPHRTRRSRDRLFASVKRAFCSSSLFLKMPSMRKNLFFFLLVLARFVSPKTGAFAVVVQKWPLKLHSNSSVSLEAGENNTILFDSDVTTIHNKLTIYVDDDFDFSSEFEPAAKALDELEVDFFDAFQAPICSSGGYTCALLDDKSLKCWGGNYFGQLGLGDTNNRGDASGEMGDNLPVVDLGTGRTATAISCDYSSTCALLDDKSVKCWGGNYNGQLGLGDTNNRGDASGEMGDNLPVVDLGSNYLHTYFNDEVES